jgi:general secretion pathway protein G
MNQKAFTILELLVVISVLVILIGIAIPRFKGMKDAATIVQVKKDLQTIQTAIESYCTFSQNTKCDYTQGGAISTEASATTRVQEALITAKPTIISSQLFDPFAAANTGYGFWTGTGGKCYVIFSIGPQVNCDAGEVGSTIDMAAAYNHTTGVFTPPASCTNMLYVSNNSKCT